MVFERIEQQKIRRGTHSGFVDRSSRSHGGDVMSFDWLEWQNVRQDTGLPGLNDHKFAKGRSGRVIPWSLMAALLQHSFCHSCRRSVGSRRGLDVRTWR